MAYTNICCRSGGSNLNAGTRTGDTTEPGTSADLTYAAGAWVNATRVFTVASGDPVADGVAVDDYAALDTGGATAAYIARVSARTTTTITLVATGMGTNPGDGTYTLRIGGALAGPSGTTTFPLNSTLTGTGLLDAAGDGVRVNLKNDQTYSMTAGITTATGPSLVQGYSSSYGDGGRAVIDGGTSGASYVLLTTGINTAYADLVIQNNGATGSANGVSVAAITRVKFNRCCVNSFRGSGIAVTTGDLVFVEGEAYACNQSNTANLAAITVTTGSLAVARSFIHDNAGSNTSGVFSNSTGGAAIVVLLTVFDTNGGVGVKLTGAGSCTVYGCVFYNNTGSGVNISNAMPTVVENSVFALNAAYGVEGSTAGVSKQVVVTNCAFYSNTSGQTNNLASEQVTGSVTLSGDPFVDAANGDFDLNNTAGAGAACRGAGAGTFTQTAASYTGTLGYPDIGASQHQDAGGGGPVAQITGSRNIGTY